MFKASLLFLFTISLHKYFFTLLQLQMKML